MSHPAPVVVLVGKLWWPQILALANRLHLEGVTCFIVDEVGREYRMPFVYDQNTRDSRKLQVRDTLLRWRDDPRLRLVVPMTEDLMPVCHDVFAGTGHLLNEDCPVPLSTLLSKSLMLEQARQAGLIVPRSEIIQSADRGLAIARQWGYPVMLKGDGGAAGSQVSRCNDPTALIKAFERLSELSVVSIQEWLDGEIWAAGGYFEMGSLRRLHIYQKLPLNGSLSTAPSEKIRHQTLPQAKEDLERLGKHLNWNGYGQIDYIGRRSGELVFLEFNPRVWGSITAADAAGGDMLVALALRATIQRVDRDLNNHDGWSGLVYPKPLPRLAAEGRWLDVVRLLLSQDFRRSRPGKAWSWRLEFFFIRMAYWSFMHARARKSHQRLTENPR